MLQSTCKVQVGLSLYCQKVEGPIIPLNPVVSISLLLVTIHDCIMHVLCTFIMYATKHVHIGTTTIEEPGIVIYHPGVTVELTCDVNRGAGWIVNGVSFFLGNLRDGRLPDHNVNGSNILIMNNPGNYSQYVCTNGINNGGVYRIVVAGEYVDLFYMYNYNDSLFVDIQSTSALCS